MHQIEGSNKDTFVSCYRALEQLTFLRESLREGEDEAWGWKRCLSWGYMAISFCRNTRWWRSFDTHSSNSSGDFTWVTWSQIRIRDDADVSFAYVSPRDGTDSCCIRQNFVNEWSPLGDRCYPLCPGQCTWLSSWWTWQRGQHRCNREAFPSSAVRWNTLLVCVCMHVSSRMTDRWRSWGNTYISSTLGILHDAFLQHKVSLSGKKSNSVNIYSHKSYTIFHLLPPLNQVCCTLGLYNS